MPIDEHGVRDTFHLDPYSIMEDKIMELLSKSSPIFEFFLDLPQTHQDPHPKVQAESRYK